MSVVAASALELECQLLEGLPRHEREIVFSGATTKFFPVGGRIIQQGFPANRVYLLQTGCARNFHVTLDGRKIPMTFIRRGEVIGGISIVLKQKNYLVTAEAFRACDFLVWEREVFRGYMDRFPRLLDNAILIASDYVETLINEHVQLAALTARARLGQVLLAFGEAVGEKSSGGVLVDATNEELANAAHITKYTTCRLLADWQKNHTISKARGKILLHDTAALRATASEK